MGPKEEENVQQAELGASGSRGCWRGGRKETGLVRVVLKAKEGCFWRHDRESFLCREVCMGIQGF